MSGTRLMMFRNDSADIVVRVIYTEAKEIYRVDRRLTSNDDAEARDGHKSVKSEQVQAPKFIALV